MEKKCIVHLPFYIDAERPSGSQIRPLKIINGFKSIGYEVDVISGYGEERKLQINSIKDKIKSGVKYDFVYSESSTEPTLLTEKNHIPTHPLLDFSFLNFCRKRGLKIGLFYRDVYWKFDIYKQMVKPAKRAVAIFNYKYDLYKYKRLLDVFYLPSIIMYDYIPFKFEGKIEELPPAADLGHEDRTCSREIAHENLKIFYVGGISSLYNLELLFEAVKDTENIELTVCCREKEWESSKGIYEKFLNDRIKIIHKSGKDLEPYFENADICSLFFEPNEYRSFAMPVKLFEYISYKKPILSNIETATGDFVEKNNIGWNVEYSKEKLISCLKAIQNSPEELERKKKNVEAILQDNTWEARARKVASDLT
jgi:hypothetical protein